MAKIIKDYLFILKTFLIFCEKDLKKYFFHKEELYRPLLPLQLVEIIKDIIKRLSPRKSLEWGMGYSTLIFARLLKEGSVWYAIEHNAEWFNKVSFLIGCSKNIKAFCVSANNFPWSDINNDGSYNDLKDYIDFPERFKKFDFIFVDGRARLDCLIKSRDMLEDRGIIMLHDAERPYYHPALKLYKYSVFLSKTPKSLWIGSNSVDVNKEIEVDKYKKFLQIYSFILAEKEGKNGYFLKSVILLVYRFFYWRLIFKIKKIIRFLIASVIRALPVIPGKLGLPKGFFKSTQEWQVRFKLKNSGSKADFINVYSRNAGLNFKESNVKLSQTQKERIGSVAVIPQGRLWSEKGAVISPDGYLLTDLFRESGPPDWHERKKGKEFSIFSKFKLPVAKEFYGSVAVLLHQFYTCYYVWMFRVLPRFYILQESGFNLNDIDNFVVNRTWLTYIKNSLEIFGIPSQRVIEAGLDLHIKAETLICPVINIRQDEASFKWRSDFLRARFLTKDILSKVRPGAERIYINRSDTDNRKVINEDAVVNFLTKLGFRSVTLSLLTIAEQVALFSSAEVVISAHGSGLANIVFCNPGTTVIEIRPTSKRNRDTYEIIAKTVGIRFYTLFVDGMPSLNKRVFFIDIEEILGVMKNAGIKLHA